MLSSLLSLKNLTICWQEVDENVNVLYPRDAQRDTLSTEVPSHARSTLLLLSRKGSEISLPYANMRAMKDDLELLHLSDTSRCASRGYRRNECGFIQSSYPIGLKANLAFILKQKNIGLPIITRMDALSVIDVSEETSIQK
jgi:hypothetical protein